MWFRRAAKPKPEPEQDGLMRDLRLQALQVSATEFGLVPTPTRPDVWGVIVELGYPAATATLLVLAEGTTSLYLSSGGGVVGAGLNPRVQAASEALLDQAQRDLARLTLARETPMPRVGEIRIYVRTFTTTLGAGAAMRDVVGESHPLAPLHAAAQDVLTQIRESTPS